MFQNCKHRWQKEPDIVKLQPVIEIHIKHDKSFLYFKYPCKTNLTLLTLK